MIKIESYLKEMYTILDEIDEAKDNISKVIEEMEALDREYLNGKYEYKKYLQLKKKILANRSKRHVIDLYNNYVLSLKNRLKVLNKKTLKRIYEDKTFETLKISKFKRRIKTHLPSMYDLDIEPIVTEEIPKFDIPKEEKLFKVHEILKPHEIKVEKPYKKPITHKIEKPHKKLHKEPVKHKIPEPHKVEKLEVKPKVEFKKEEPIDLKKYKVEIPKIGSDELLDLPKRSKRFKPLKQKKSEEVELGGVFSKIFFKNILARKKKKSVFGHTTVLPSILSYENKPKVAEDLGVGKTDILDPYLLEKQIKELKSLISRRKPEVYKASSLGYLANVTVRKISIYFIEKYPKLFKSLYKAVRFANMRILANTYINIIFFMTIISALISLPLFTVFFTLQGNSVAWIISKTLLSTILLISVTFWIGFYYPFMKLKSRTRSINTNLPFSIDHMSSVIASGVSPATMFKLISNSREYGEISIELEKISNYIDFFGYDILTAMRAVALTTPSTDFKEFLDGFVSTIETGGDLKQYLSQKSSEALLNYRLERQKYVEALGTYSDIYTGVLIAAPLFFVTALSLVSVLGGTIGGLGVNTIITIGTYLVIPALNFIFLIFLELNQPEI